MTWITQLRQRSLWVLLLIGLGSSLTLVACGQQVNASDTNTPSYNSTSQQLQNQPPQATHMTSQSQPKQSTHASSSNASSSANSNLQGTDQQVQSILHQLDGARNDVNSSNTASSQDNGQQP